MPGTYQKLHDLLTVTSGIRLAGHAVAWMIHAAPGSRARSEICAESRPEGLGESVALSVRPAASSAA